MFFFEEDFNSFLLQGGSCTINNGKITLTGKDQASVDKMKTKVDQNITDMHLYLKKRILYLTYEEYRLCEANIPMKSTDFVKRTSEICVHTIKSISLGVMTFLTCIASK